ncbi:MAG: MATE family efflux transporter [Clostridia bacterium]|nr:MATE family efflux transporter [Clostridia bacterium]
MKIGLSDKFTYGKLLRFTLPSIFMMIFTSVYGIVDGFFVSNFVGKTPFAAVNFIMPFLMILGTVGFMFGAGGSALVAKTLGEGKREEANRIFSLIVYVSAALGVVLGVLGILFIRPLARLLGAEGEMLAGCVQYGRIILIAIPLFILQMEFQSFFITAEKPTLGLVFTLAAGITNIVLDAVFVGLCRWGLVGAAAATAVGQAVGAVGPLIYFFGKNGSLLHLGKTRWNGKALWRTCTNGSSEFMSNVAMSVVSMLYNMQLMKYAGENGVAAYGVLMYVSLVFNAIFIGYAIGTAPIVGYNYGALNTDELRSVFRKSLLIILIASVCMVGLAEGLATPLSKMFTRYDPELLALTKRGFFIYSFVFLFAGINIYGSSFFTALNNGLVSAVISFLRTLVFQISAVLVLPIFWATDGIWVSIVIAEVAAVIVTVIFLLALRKRYGY